MCFYIIYWRNDVPLAAHLNRRGGYYPPVKPYLGGRLAKRVQWFRGDPESRKTFGEEERQQSGFRRFAKRNTEKAEFAATKRARYGA